MKRFSRSLGQEIRRMREKQASFREEETASREEFASLYLKEEVHWYNGRPPVLLRGQTFQRQAHVSPVALAILAKTFQAESSTAHEEASKGRVFGMNGCHPGLSSSKRPFLSTYATSNFGERLWPCLSTLTKGGAKLALPDLSREQLYGFSSSSIMQRFRIQYSKIVAPRSGMQFLKLGVFPLKPRSAQTDLVSLELSYRAKGMQEMCGGGSTFPSECGATPYWPRLKDNG